MDPFNDPAPAGGRTTLTLTLSSFLGLFAEVEVESDGYVVTCPAHVDSRPSLWTAYNPASKKLILKCRAGCNTEDVVTALDLVMADLFDIEPGDLADIRTAGRVPDKPSTGDRAALKLYLNRAAAALRDAL